MQQYMWFIPKFTLNTGIGAGTAALYWLEVMLTTNSTTLDMLPQICSFSCKLLHFSISYDHHITIKWKTFRKYIRKIIS